MNRNPDKISGLGKFWYDEDLNYHNDEFPAIILSNGTKEWYRHGFRHNDNGPAINFANRDKAWYIDGKELTEKEFKQYKIKQFIYGK